MEAQLVARLVDGVSGPARQVAAALRAADQQARALQQASASGMSSRLATDLQRLGATAPQIRAVSAAWDQYRRQAGLAADSTKWTQAQIREVRAWERANVSAIRAVTQAGHRIHGGIVGPGAAEAAGMSAVQGGLVGAAAARMGVMATAAGAAVPAMAGYAAIRGNTRFADVDRRMARVGLTGDADPAETRAGIERLRDIARETALSFNDIRGGMEAITASGRNFGDAIAMMGSVARTAQASGAGVDDIANSSTALIDHLKISIEGLQQAQDTLARGGELGKFELKDMARYLPSMLPAFKALGYEGQEGLQRLVAMLQVIRAGTGTAEEAAASANNIFAKMESETTAKNFKEMGVDLEKAMAKARKEGRDLLSVFIELTEKALKGDLSKLPKLFNDMEFARGMRALLTGVDNIRRFEDQLRSSSGTIQRNLSRIATDAQASMDRAREATDRATTAFGGLVAQLASPAAEDFARRIDGVAQSIENVQKQVRERGFVQAFKDDLSQTADFWKQFWEEGQRVMFGDRAANTSEARARDDKVARDQAEAHISQLRARADALQARLDSVPDGTVGKESIAGRNLRPQIAAARREADELQQALAARDRANLDLIEFEAARRGQRTRMGLTPDGKPQPITPGLIQFGFGPQGQRDYERAVKNAPHPPVRPLTLNEGPVRLREVGDIANPGSKPSSGREQQLEGMREANRASALGAVKPIEAIGEAADKAKSSLEGINGTSVAPSVDPSSVIELNRHLDQTIDKLLRINGLGNSARQNLSSLPISSPSPGRGRSDVAQATAESRRSRETSNEDRPYA